MIGPLVAAGASLLGGFLNQKASDKAADKAYQQQKEFAQSGIQWKVEDAKKAGIHPALALGAQPASFSPSVSTGDLGSGIAAAGQDISRAIDTTRTSSSRQDAFTTTMQSLTLQKAGLENEYLASQIAKIKQQVGPPMAPTGTFQDYLIPGQTGSGLPVPKSHEGKLPQFTTNLRGFGTDILPHPGFSDAQTYEDRYGEMSDYVAGPMIAVADYFYNKRNANWGNPFNLPYKNFRGR